MEQTKIPIPSFRPPPPHIRNEASKNAEKLSSDDEADTSKDSTKKKIHPILNQNALINLETALQLHLMRHQQQKEDQISYVDFITIATKIDKNVAPKETKDLHCKAGNDGSSESLGLWKLSGEERLWHDLYCVAVPTLYRIDNPQKTMALTQVSFTSALKTGEGEIVRTGGNRLKQLRQLIGEARTKGIDKEKSDWAFDHLQKKKIFDEERRKILSLKVLSCSNEKRNKNRIDSLLQDVDLSDRGSALPVLTREERENIKSPSRQIQTSTIEDRVRARAREREQNLYQAEAAKNDPREERVSVADSLYSYATHFLRRTRSRPKYQTSKKMKKIQTPNPIKGIKLQSSSSRFLNHTNNNENGANNSRCAVTFKEVVDNALPNRSRKEITRLMLDIVQVLSMSSLGVDGFLKWRDPKGGDINGTLISKNATVWIETAHFKDVRAILNKNKIPKETEGEQYQNSQKKRPIEDSQNDYREHQVHNKSKKKFC